MQNDKERKEEFKDRLRRAMNVRGMKSVELCERSGVPKSAVSYYLAGKSKPKADRLYIISKALDVSEAWLMGYDVPMDRAEKQKKIDQLAELIDKLRSDPDFFEAVSLLSKLPPEQFESVKLLMAAALPNK